MDLSVREALEIDGLKDAKLIAGGKGLDRLIYCVDISETPDAYKWVRPHEFLITAGYSIRDNLKAQLLLLHSLAEVNGAGLAIKFGRFIGDIPKELSELADQLEFPLIGLPDDLPFIDITYPLMQHIVNAQAQRLAYSERIYLTLTKIALETNSLDALAKSLGDILHQNIYIYAHHLRASVISELQNNQVFPVEVKQKIYGYIAVETSQQLSEQDMIAIKHAQTLAALQLMNRELATESAWNEKRDFFDELISGKKHNMELLRARATEIGFSLAEKKYLCMVDVDDFSQYLLQYKLTEQEAFNLRRTLFHIVQDELSVSYGVNQSLVVQQSDRVIAICPITLSEKKQQDQGTQLKGALSKIHEKVSIMLHDITLTIGVSNEIQRLEDFSGAYQQVRRVVAISRKINGMGQDFFQKDAEVYLLLEKMDVLPFYETTLSELECAKNSTELLHTMEVYLACQGNLSETAGKLFIHRNTLRYRLSRIEGLLGKDLNSSETRFMLWLALKARQLQLNN